MLSYLAANHRGMSTNVMLWVAVTNQFIDCILRNIMQQSIAAKSIELIMMIDGLRLNKMAYWYIPKFEDEAKTKAELKAAYHRDGCNHKDCKEVQQIRLTPCPVCGKKFEADDMVCTVETTTYHFSCAIEKFNPEVKSQ
jgi:hypothetical protein